MHALPTTAKIAEVWAVLGPDQFAKEAMKIVGEKPPPAGMNGATLRDVGAFQIATFKLDTAKSSEDNVVVVCKVEFDLVWIKSAQPTMHVFLRDAKNNMSNLISQDVTSE